jgi:hypothetical protein
MLDPGGENSGKAEAVETVFEGGCCDYTGLAHFLITMPLNEE